MLFIVAMVLHIIDLLSMIKAGCNTTHHQIPVFYFHSAKPIISTFTLFEKIKFQFLGVLRMFLIINFFNFWLDKSA